MKRRKGFRKRFVNYEEGRYINTPMCMTTYPIGWRGCTFTTALSLEPKFVLFMSCNPPGEYSPRLIPFNLG